RQEKLKGKHHAPGSKAWFTAIKEHKRFAELKIERDNYIVETSARAKFWGTSFNSIEHREGMEKLDKGKSVSKSNKKLEQLEQEFAQFKIDYFSVMNISADHYRYKGHTSDDTKELEL
ncbi:hypothetical protein RhiirC2_795832, partial [Rhizophagus irregularis]